MNDPIPTSFVAANSPRLREAGLKGGYARVALAGQALEFTGSEGGGVRLAADRLDRLRLGFSQGRGGHPHFQALIWPAGEARPILLLPLGDEADKAAYGAAMRGLAAALARTRGLDRVEGGLSRPAAIGGLALVAFPAVLAAVFAVRAASNGDGLVPLAGALLVAGLAGAFWWAYQRRSFPRRVASLAQLDRLTPGPDFRL